MNVSYFYEKYYYDPILLRFIDENSDNLVIMDLFMKYKDDYSSLKEISTKPIELSDCEKSYRRGYRQGFYSGRNSDVNENDVNLWSYSDHTIAPPGSGFSEMPLHGLTKNDEHIFFINRLEKPDN